MRTIAASLVGLFLVGGCATAPADPTPGKQSAAPSAPARPLSQARTEVRDAAALVRLRGNSGLTLQWIGWERRGLLEVWSDDGLVRVRGTQDAANGSGRLELEGSVVSIDAASFLFRGRILMIDAPDSGRRCERTGDMEFRITQNRKYWRLQRMEACDGLTDYVDIYF